MSEWNIPHRNAGTSRVIMIGHPVGKRLTLPSDYILSDSKFLEARDWLNDEQYRLALTF